MRTNAGRARRAGFTLIEMLVVICIMLILMALLVVLIKGAIDKARITKTKGLIEALTAACAAYHVDFGAFPPTSYPKSASLHAFLGAPRVVPLYHDPTGAAPTTLKPPYFEFKRDMLPNNATTVLPDPAPFEVIDAWGQGLEYRNPGGPTGNPKGVDIWSYGRDQADDAGANDDITNWFREF